MPWPGCYVYKNRCCINICWTMKMALNTGSLQMWKKVTAFFRPAFTVCTAQSANLVLDVSWFSDVSDTICSTELFSSSLVTQLPQSDTVELFQTSKCLTKLCARCTDSCHYQLLWLSPGIRIICHSTGHTWSVNLVCAVHWQTNRQSGHSTSGLWACGSVGRITRKTGDLVTPQGQIKSNQILFRNNKDTYTLAIKTKTKSVVTWWSHGT